MKAMPAAARGRPDRPCTEDLAASTTVVILAGTREFGRCPIAARLPRPLWPLVDRPILAHQLRHLWKRGFKNVVVCGNGSMAALGAWVEWQQFPGMAVRFLSDGKPRGTAGCVRDAVAGEAGGQVLIIKGAVVWMEDADLLLKQHQAGQAALTVFTQDAFAGAGSEARPAGIYVCETGALAAVPREGYQDVKEQLIPNLLRKGERVRAVPVPGGTLSYRNVSEYLQVVGHALKLPEKFALDLDGFEEQGDGTWAAGGVAVAPTARLYGPVVLLEGCTLEDQALVVGPAVIGRRARVGAGAVVTGSVLWDEASVGPGTSVSGSLLDAGARVGRGLRVENGAVPGRGTARGSARRGRQERGPAVGFAAQEKRRRAQQALLPAQPAPDPAATSALVTRGPSVVSVETGRQGKRPALGWAGLAVAAAALFCAFAWSYSDVLTDLWNTWQRDDNYSSGVLVPFLAAYLVLSRRKQLAQLEHRPSFLGLWVILTAFVLRFLGSALMLGSVERFSTVVAIVGIVLFLFGVQVTRRLGWVLAFLLLMLPWPNRVYTAASLPLQSLATKSTVFVLETLGYFVTHEGNIIHVEDTTVAVAEQCSGLHMLTAFLIVAALVAFLCRRGVGQKMLLVASSVPIAILCNTIRLTATAIAFTAGYHEQVNQFFHDFGGVAMMPLALALLAGELWVMKLLFVRGGVATPSAAGTN